MSHTWCIPIIFLFLGLTSHAQRWKAETEWRQGRAVAIHDRKFLFDINVHPEDEALSLGLPFLKVLIGPLEYHYQNPQTPDYLKPLGVGIKDENFNIQDLREPEQLKGVSHAIVRGIVLPNGEAFAMVSVPYYEKQDLVFKTRQGMKQGDPFSISTYVPERYLYVKIGSRNDDGEITLSEVQTIRYTSRHQYGHLTLTNPIIALSAEELRLRMPKRLRHSLAIAHFDDGMRAENPIEPRPEERQHRRQAIYPYESISAEKPFSINGISYASIAWREPFPQDAESIALVLYDYSLLRGKHHYPHFLIRSSNGSEVPYIDWMLNQPALFSIARELKY